MNVKTDAREANSRATSSPFRAPSALPARFRERGRAGDVSERVRGRGLDEREALEIGGGLRDGGHGCFRRRSLSSGGSARGMTRDGPRRTKSLAVEFVLETSLGDTRSVRRGRGVGGIRPSSSS
eukprot:31157-Pelagococcus_subviridis.AAC.12